MTVLIFCRSGDPCVATVKKILLSKGVKPIIFERYRKDHLASFCYQDNKHYGSIKVGKKTYDLTTENFNSVWSWIKPYLAAEIPGAEHKDKNEKFAVSEWRHALVGFDVNLRNSKWINPLPASRIMQFKATQLAMAAQANLLIPETLISNDIDSLLKLIKKNRTIYKSLSSYYSPTKAIFTKEINEKLVLNSPESIAITPGIFQALVEKKYELRVIVIRNKVFVYKIDSQKYEETSIDWRKAQRDDMFSKFDLSKETTNKLLSFHKASGLIYAAYDFIVDKDGREIFLECNPSGQWFWGDDIGQEASEALVDEMISA